MVFSDREAKGRSDQLARSPRPPMVNSSIGRGCLRLQKTGFKAISDRLRTYKVARSSSVILT